MRWVLVAAMAPLLGYGLLNLVTPRLTTRWQVRATTRHGEESVGDLVGRTFQWFVGIEPDSAPDGAALRRVRIVGLIEIAVAFAIVVLVYSVKLTRFDGHLILA
jgi:hypothetical protein